MNYVNFVLRKTGDIFSYDMDDEAQRAAILPGLEELSDSELADVRSAQAAANAPTPEQILEAANAKRDELLGVASLRIAPLQDAVDIDEATEDDVLNLTLWKQYRVAVNRVSSQPGFPSVIEWPNQPSQ